MLPAWGRLLRRGWPRRPGARGFLSPAYACADAWRAALDSSLLARVHLDELYARAVADEAPPSTVDVDLLALGAALKGSHLEEMRDLLHRHRASASGADLPASAMHSAIVAYLEHGDEDELLEVLDDRVNYGVFLGRRTANALLDRFLVRGDGERAARVAAHLALQEDFEGPITKSMAQLAAYRYLESVDPSPPKVEVVEAATATPAPKKKKKVEEVKIRVQYLRNPFFDDHFDLRDPILLGGKTLAAVSKLGGEPLDRNCRLIGETFYEKGEKAERTAKELKEKNEIYRDTVVVLERLHKLIADDKKKLVEGVLGALAPTETREASIDEELTARVKLAVERYEKEEIDEHIKQLAEWEAQRRSSLKEQIERIENARRERAIAAREEELKKLDDNLWFFDNKDNVELMISRREYKYPKRWWGPKKKSKVAETSYIPPEVR